MPKIKLGAVEFGRQLVLSEDLDPVYVMLHKAKLPPQVLRKWLVAYWCFYHVGTASWITDHPKYWPALHKAAASKDYPRSSERRHFRGAFAIKAAELLEERGVDGIFGEFDRAAYERRVLTLEDVMDYVKEWYGFGDWIAFKVADMLERLNLCRVAFTEVDTFLFDSPKKGAALVQNLHAKCDCNSKITHHHNCPRVRPGWALDYLQENLGHLEAPPRKERKLNGQEYETVLCKFKSHWEGGYHVGKDITEVRHGLEKFQRCKTAQLLLKHVPKEYSCV